MSAKRTRQWRVQLRAGVRAAAVERLSVLRLQGLKMFREHLIEERIQCL
jgi:hypothetical protein